MKILEFLKNRKKRANVFMWMLVLAIIVVVIWGSIQGRNPLRTQVDDGIERIDLDTIHLKNSGVEVNFSEVLLSEQNETRKLIISAQSGTVTTELTDWLIKQLDFDFLKKTQSVSYTGAGYFVVDLDHLTAANVVQDWEKKTVIIIIDHAYLQAIDINPSNIIIDEVKEGQLARGDIELTVRDYNIIEKGLRAKLVDKFDTISKGKATDDIALKMVEEVYEPIVKAIDRRYDRLFLENKRRFARYIGQAKTVFAADTYQFDDYSKYESSVFDS